MDRIAKASTLRTLVNINASAWPLIPPPKEGSMAVRLYVRAAFYLSMIPLKRFPSSVELLFVLTLAMAFTKQRSHLLGVGGSRQVLHILNG